VRDEIRAWWEQAREDLKTAEVTLAGKRYYACVFFCQQAVEKALKAFLLKKTRNPQAPEMFSHSLICLGKTCRVPEALHSFLRDLTAEYVNTRYPSAGQEPPEELYDAAIASRTLKHAKELFGWTGKHL